MGIKKCFTIVLIICGIWAPLLSKNSTGLENRNPFYDAMLLSQKITEYEKLRQETESNKLDLDDKKQWIIIYLNAYSPETEIRSIEDAKKVFTNEKNPFVYDVIKDIEDFSITEMDFKSNKLPSAREKSLIGGVSAAKIIPALGKLIASRIKHGLVISFLNNLRDKFKKELSTLFPETTGKFEILIPKDPDELDLTGLINGTKKAFQKDLDNILVNLPTFLAEKSGSETKVKWEYNLVFSFLTFFKEAMEGKKPDNFINSLSNRIKEINIDPGKKGLYSIINSVKFTSLIWDHLNNYPWDKEKLKNGLNEEKTIKLMFGFFLVKEKDKLDEFKIYFRNGETPKSFKCILIEESTKIKNFTSYMSDFLTILNEFKSHWEKGNEIEIKVYVKKEDKRKEKAENYKKYLKTTIKAFKLLVGFNNFLEVIEIDEDKANEYEKFVNGVKEIIINVLDEKYGEAFFAALSLLEEENLFPKVAKNIRKYVLPIYNIMQAKDYKEVYDLLLTYAKPYSTFMAKRVKKQLNITLNAYPGFILGREEFTYEGDKKVKWYSTSFTAPVGLSINKRIGRLSGSISLFLPVIDVAAVTKIFISETDSELPELSWKDVFAPGAYLIYGFKKIPLSIGLGGHIGPIVREIKIDKNDNLVANKSKSFRFGLIIAMDITLF